MEEKIQELIILGQKVENFLKDFETGKYLPYERYDLYKILYLCIVNRTLPKIYCKDKKDKKTLNMICKRLFDTWSLKKIIHAYEYYQKSKF